MNSIVRALSEAGDAARGEGRRLPVIVTDRRTAQVLVAAIAKEIGCTVPDLSGRNMPPGVVGMFDGVQIKAA